MTHLREPEPANLFRDFGREFSQPHQETPPRIGRSSAVAVKALEPAKSSAS